MIITAYEDAHMIAANVALLGTAAYFIATLLVLVGIAWVWQWAFGARK